MTKLIGEIGHGVRKLLRPTYPSEDPIFQRINKAYLRSQYLVRFYYLISAFIVYGIMIDFHFAAERSEAWDFLWPDRWLNWLGAPRAAPECLTLVLFVASLFAFQFYNKVSARVIFAVACWMVVALTNSRGASSHSYHVWLWIGVCFAFLPSTPLGSASREFKMSYLSVIVATQSLILFFYTLAGLWKVRRGLIALYYGVEGNFAPRGFALQLADRSLATGTKPFLADFAISHYWLVWPLFIAVMYFQLTAVCVAVRPRLQLVWGYFLMSFHLGTWLLMEIGFPEQMLFTGLLLAMSPFQPTKWRFRTMLADLPGVEIFTRLIWLWRKHAAPIRQPAHT